MMRPRHLVYFVSSLLDTAIVSRSYAVRVIVDRFDHSGLVRDARTLLSPVSFFSVESRIASTSAKQTSSAASLKQTDVFGFHLGQNNKGATGHQKLRKIPPTGEAPRHAEDWGYEKVTSG